MSPTDRDEAIVLHALHDAPAGPARVEGQRAFTRLMLRLRTLERERRAEDDTQEIPIEQGRGR